ncbi:MAG: ArnT family glycosyltransferase [Chloroflexaceae bacterium]
MLHKRPAARGSLGLTVTPLALVYLGLRLPTLLALPLFNDEAVYLVRARFFPAMLSTPGAASATLPDGKLLHELVLAALASLPVDPLIPARLLSVVCGLATALTLVLTGRSLGHPRAGVLAGVMYALAPLAHLHDVLGLPDSMLALGSALLLWASIGFASRPTADRRDALLVGALLGAASLVKLSGLFLFAVPVLAVLLLSVSRPERWRRLALLRLP